MSRPVEITVTHYRHDPDGSAEADVLIEGDGARITVGPFMIRNSDWNGRTRITLGTAQGDRPYSFRPDVWRSITNILATRFLADQDRRVGGVR